MERAVCVLLHHKAIICHVNAEPKRMAASCRLHLCICKCHSTFVDMCRDYTAFERTAALIPAHLSSIISYATHSVLTNFKKEHSSLALAARTEAL